MVSLAIWSLKSHFPIIKNIITFRFSAEVLRCFTWKDRHGIKRLQFTINCLVKIPVEMARTFPELYWVAWVSGKEMMEFLKNGHSMNLKWMRWEIKNFFSHVNRVSDNYDFKNVLLGRSLVNTTSDSKQLSFCTSNKSHMM